MTKKQEFWALLLGVLIIWLMGLFLINSMKKDSSEGKNLVPVHRILSDEAGESTGEINFVSSLPTENLVKDDSRAININVEKLEKAGFSPIFSTIMVQNK